MSAIINGSDLRPHTAPSADKHAGEGRRPNAGRLLSKGAIYLVVLAFLIGQILPLAWALMASFKSPADLAQNPSYALPVELYFGNYIRVLTDSNLPLYFLNSTIVAVLTIGITVILGAPAAFAIEKLSWKRGQAVMAYFLVGIMIPIFVALLPMFQAYNAVGLRNTFWAVVIPQVGFNLPICIYLYGGFMRYVPNSLLEAAQLDGAGPWRVFSSLIFPLARNTTITVITFNFIFVWNEFVFANTFLTNDALKTLPVGLNDFVGTYGARDWGATFAAIVISLLPTLILYFFLNKQVIEGMAAGAVRG